MSNRLEIFWDKGKLYCVTGFNQAVPAEQTPLAQRLVGRWQTPFELAQLMIKGGYRLVERGQGSSQGRGGQGG
ncbi:MAG: hypothetical protein OHK0012_19780 [Synechococcales cyanobacterium]